MKKFLLLTAALMLGIAANAENTSKVFGSYFSEYYGSEMSLSGMFKGVSGNGKYAVGYDDGVFDYISYIWNADKPDELEYFRFNCYMEDVADDGTVVGAYLPKQGVNEGGPAIYKDGVWTDLPMHETCIGTDPGTNTAVRISPDGKYIAGMLFCEHSAGGDYKIYPCLWTRNDNTGEYELNVYNNIDLPEHQGFIVYDMSDDGRYIVGRVFTGFGSTIPAYIKDGKFNIFNELTQETYIEEWDGNGNGVFDPDNEEFDVYLETTDYYIDGVKDQAQCDGQIMGVDNNGNMIGWITILNPEDGSGYNTGFVFNEEKNESIVEIPYMFGCAIQGDDCIFASNGAYGPVYYMKGLNDTGIKMSDAFGIEDTSYSLVTEISADSKVVIGGTVFVGEVTMNQPFIVNLEQPCSGVQKTPTESEKIVISTNNGEINVIGADNVAVYSLNGTLVSNKANTSVPAGIYVVKADDKVAKVIVK